MTDEQQQLTSVEVREQLVEALRLDLVGPGNDHEFANELLPETPRRWYLTGFLVPTGAPLSQRFDEDSTEEIDSPAERGGLDDAANPDQAAANRNHRSLLPSSLGVSVFVPVNASKLVATVNWGDYKFETDDEQAEPATGETLTEDPEDETGIEAAAKAATASAVSEPQKRHRGWRRTPQTRTVEITNLEPQLKPLFIKIPDSGGMELVVISRKADVPGVMSEAWSVSVFLVNSRQANEERPYQAFAFQAGIELACAEGFVARSDPRFFEIEDDWDQRVADLQYRDVSEYAVGHGVSTQAVIDEGTCRDVTTTWVPTAEVERVAPAILDGVELGMEALSELEDGASAIAMLSPLADQYADWIKEQRQAAAGFSGNRSLTANDMLLDAETACKRIREGISLLTDPDVLVAFRLANKAVARAFRQREAQNTEDRDPARIPAPRWRPFQLAYLLMTIRGIVEPTNSEREIVDLLFFPTGGGKTEAYLALAAFTIVLRRLRSKDADGKPTVESAGVCVLMRYTLRLLTLDQLSRAAGLICALELERQENEELLGSWPFEIGLWVGQAATPNRMGERGDKSSQQPYTAYTKTMQFIKDDRKPSPIPLEECPWCGKKFNRNSFRLVPNNIKPRDLRVHCANRNCEFTGDRTLPIVAVDEPIYRRLPCFLIATVDKFAALPWIGQSGALLGKVNRYDEEGFYGPCDPKNGKALPSGQLPPLDLIIQDELHLISGPLGTVAGLYETAIDALSTVQINGSRVRPKIIASTATVRRAENQVRALFGHFRVSVFPPPGPDRRDSFFAHTLRAAESPARLYMGISAQGRSLKVVLLRTALALLAAGQVLWDQAGGSKNKHNPVDPYMTLLGYFNSLRELGGSRRIIEDEVRTRLADYYKRHRLEPRDRLFKRRQISYDVLELTSRVSTNDVAAAKRRLAMGFAEDEKVDVALATNMISVGLDIVRLGLMVVLGQPKASAEYIQATSRVGRDPARPGLVVTLLNIHKPRDRSHYERFSAYHGSFYRSVEPTSVTPFSPRALDKALVAALVALCRHGDSILTPPVGASEILTRRKFLADFCSAIAERAGGHKADLTEAEREELSARVFQLSSSLLDDWLVIAKQARDHGSGIQYQRENNSPPQRLLHEYLHQALPNLHPLQRRFRANRSMRDVEENVDIAVLKLADWGESND